MMSFGELKTFITVVYCWFAIGAGVIAVFAAKELITLIKMKKPNETEK